MTPQLGRKQTEQKVETKKQITRKNSLSHFSKKCKKSEMNSNLSKKISKFRKILVKITKIFRKILHKCLLHTRFSHPSSPSFISKYFPRCWIIIS